MATKTKRRKKPKKIFTKKKVEKVKVHEGEVVQEETGLVKVPVTVGTAKHLILTDDPKWITQAMVQASAEIALAERIPISGLCILGGRFYINAGGLDAKVANKCADENLIKSSVRVEPEKGEEQTGILEDGSCRYAYRGIVELFDKVGFERALVAVVKSKKEITEAIIDRLQKIYVYRFEDVGVHTTSAERMSTIQQSSNIQMKASRKASSRAKRAATSCGLTSVEEMTTDLPVTQPQGRLQTSSGWVGRKDGDRPAGGPQAASRRGNDRRPEDRTQARTIKCRFEGEHAYLSGDTIPIKDWLKDRETRNKIGSTKWIDELQEWMILATGVQTVKDHVEGRGMEFVEVA